MVTLEQLDRARLARERINECRIMMQSIRASTGLKAQDPEKPSNGSGPSDPTGHIAIILTDLEKTIQSHEIEFLNAWAPCEHFVSEIPDPITKTCFRLRFQYGMSYKEIAASLKEQASECSVKARIYREIRKQKKE